MPNLFVQLGERYTDALHSVTLFKPQKVLLNHNR